MAIFPRVSFLRLGMVLLNCYRGFEARFRGATPASAGEVQLGVQSVFAAGRTAASRIVFEKLDCQAAMGADQFEDVFRRPKAQILTRTNVLCHRQPPNGPILWSDQYLEGHGL